MTRSDQTMSRRKAFTKSVRATAHKEGTLFKIALDKRLATQEAKKFHMPYIHTRNEERHSRGGSFICHVKLDDADYSTYDEDVYVYDPRDFEDHTHVTDRTVSLLEIARPAKEKGIAKEYEVVRTNVKVVALPLGDEEFEIWEEADLWEDDWEEIYDDERGRVGARKSYSSVLRGTDSET